MIKIVVKRIINFLVSFLPVQNHIILESHPDLGGNTYPLFQVMLKEKLNEKYPLIWLVNDKDKYKNYNVENVYFKNISPNNFFEKVSVFLLEARAKCIITENRFIRKRNKHQLVLYLSHGTVLKNVSNLVTIGPFCDYVLYQSEFVKELTGEQLRVKDENLVCLGFPRNDNLFIQSDCVKTVFQDREFKKVIIWMPTFRQHMDKKRVDSNAYFPLGIPAIDSVDQLHELNQYLHEREILLVLKPHPVQDLSVLKVESLTNFAILYDSDLRKHDVQLYEFIGNTDALITDYSSIYFDYLLTNKPVGLTISDVKEYGGKLGFAYENIWEVLKGEYINDLPDFLRFIDHLSKGIDEKRAERDQIRDLMNHYKDNGSARRVYEFIKEKANL